MLTDRWLTRLIGVTVCALAVICTAAYVAAVLTHVESSPLKELAILFGGGLLGRLSTRSGNYEPVPVTDVTPYPPTEALPD
jgi:hypothetical protein